MTLSRLVFDFVRRHRRAYVRSALMLLGVALLTVWIPRQVGYLVDRLAAGGLPHATLLAELGWLIGAAAMIYLLRAGWRLQLFAASYQLGVELRTRLYERLSLQGPRFYQEKRTGDLMALATNDVDAVEMAAGEAMLAGFDGTLTFVMVIAMMTLGLDWRLTLIALLPFPLMAWAFKSISERVHQYSREALDCFSDLNDHVQETLSGVRTVRALGLEGRSQAELSRRAERAAHASLKAQCWEAAYEPAVGLTLSAASVIALAVGGYFVWQGEFSVGKLTAFGMYLGQLIWPMFAAGWVMSLIERGRAAWSRLEPVLSAPLTVDDHGHVTPLTPGPLALNAVQFRYPDQTQPALDGVSIQINPGETLGIVGPTGAGKSSVLRLLLRHFAPDAGTLSWNGVALQDYPLTDLHAAMAWVPQESFLFSASIAENIALARPGASRAEIEHAAQLAAIHDDILHFPLGYDTPVGERGVTLSGGQRQRVAIARALLADAPLLLLDDALSAVDTQTETQILRHLREARQGRMVIIVSHRLSAVMDADQIVVLKRGQVVERGDHAQLVAADGWYAGQWRYQQLEASLDAS
jgi:ATP-binding cassette subfamily B protein/ATP-binding cassette subfamily C protein/ATP-binding cassette subfamily B multidrug efflux pump